ncbi:2-amino-4-hydroxy-6-hydroxymethyldihydropteridine diphosphokinase [Wenyingzhuangia sp. chi5]|uniref:2-amino-4-hydroxy-6-hydroxymethyldihydropteridine pyrophosphokinase n=1 Tax=Wenyingzhuangia gilva TaxID=3057677 RepID=A0ABT8VQJ2_9FLAO|nr:2-amino-4-hydroxy-6-hydroxymethyldihydropteridine diphosphokinase [Wenyingzhuangia sp. chi5]MDO3694237.1 2-amino-4-hydroxy-6-hydroxymethyldihydropteridine diphosphokinase [Wenyingzhuangia sp. chi5]
MNIAHLSLGTNLGNKLENLNDAIKKISTLGKILKISSVYQTPPWGFKSDDFFNIALTLETSLTANELIGSLLTFESELGRTRNVGDLGYQARPLDIDIIFFNDEIINTENLTIPHPRMQDRNFVLIPLIEIVSNFNHPILNKTLETLFDECDDKSEITRTKHQLTPIN